MNYYLTNLISYTKTHMQMPNKSQLITIGCCAGFVVLSALIGKTFAGADENAALRERISQSEKRIEANSRTYAEVAPIKARNQARCGLAAQQEKQMTQLNVENNALRKEIEFIKSLLKTDPQ
jgi:hypothetical protein